MVSLVNKILQSNWLFSLAPLGSTIFAVEVSAKGPEPKIQDESYIGNPFAKTSSLNPIRPFTEFLLSLRLLEFLDSFFNAGEFLPYYLSLSSQKIKFLL